MLSQLCFCLSRTCAKYIYEAYPDMSTFQFLFLRSGVAFVFNLVMINRNLKMVLCDTVGAENRCNLVAKVIQGLVTVFLSFAAVKYFPLTYCSAVRNLSPFFALVLSAICLAEKPTFRQAFVLTLALTFSLGFVFSGDTAVGEQGLVDSNTATKVFAWSVLLLTPIMMAIGQALDRAMRKLNEHTVSIYSNST